jgi:hypothetical protein
MTPAALLVCMTVVTNVNHGSVVTNACHYQQPAVAMVPVDPMPIAAIDAVKTENAEVKALAVVDLDPKVTPAKPGLGKATVKAARVHHRAGAPAASPVMTAAQDKAFRHSWFKRLAGM